MKSRLYIVIAVFLVALVRLLYSGERLMLWILLLLATVVALSILNIVYTIFYVKIKQSVTPHELTGSEYGTLTINIHNIGVLPLAHLKVWYDTFDTMFGDGTGKYVAFTVMPGQTAGLRRPLFFPYRGVYTPGITSILACDIFGLLQFKLPARVFEYRKSVTVLPRTFKPIIDISGLNPFAGGTTGRRDESEPHSIAEIRQFRQGDPLKRIHWKLSARIGSLQSKVFDGTIFPRTRVFIDLSAHELVGERAVAFENCVCSNTATVCKSALGNNTPLRLTAFSDKLEDMQGVSLPDLPMYLSFLATVKFECKYKFIDVLRSALNNTLESGNIVIITGNISSELTSYAASLVIRGFIVSIIAISHEFETQTTDQTIKMIQGVTVMNTSPELIRPTEISAEDGEGVAIHA